MHMTTSRPTVSAVTQQRFVLQKNKVLEQFVRCCSSPVQLNRRSAAALAGRGVLILMNSAFNSGQAAMLVVSSGVDDMYCLSTSTALADAVSPGR